MDTRCGMRASRGLRGHLLAWAVICVLAATATARDETLLVRTESPRATLDSFLRLRDAGEEAIRRYSEDRTRANFERLLSIIPPFAELLDLSSVAEARREEVGSDTIDYLLDIFGRQDLPSIESVPDVDTFVDHETPAKWRIPLTPIWIVRVDDGPREGEFLFSARTVEVAPTFYRRIRHLPLRTSLPFESWTDAMSQMHGPLIPVGLVSALPDGLKGAWFGTPIWKIMAAVILGVLAALLLVLWHRVVNRREWRNSIAVRLRRILTPALIIVIVQILRPLVAFEINVSGSFAHLVDTVTTLAVYLASVWIVWLGVLTLFDWIILSPKIAAQSLDANLLRLSARVLGFLVGVFILSYGAHDLGLSVLGLITGLGVGGLAVALALRPTLENLIGGLMLYTDRPVRVGDFCSFGTHTGTVENIGLRSTQIRALDRTVISVPNANFADMEIVNWARCDMMQILTTLGLRYETEPDQLRYVLASLREMLHAHPKIDRDTVRVRFIGYGASSLDIQIRVYALTREWNEFFAIREDVFLRVNGIVDESGTGFAFPSQTVYLGRDGGLNEERRRSAIERVEAWRKSGRLPFPYMESSAIDDLAGTLDYPPLGSSGTGSPGVTETAESLSTEPAESLSTEPDESLSTEPGAQDTEDSEERPETERR